MKKIAILVLPAMLLFSAISGQTKGTLRYTVKPDSSSAVYFKTFPNCVCKLFAAEKSTPAAAHLRLYADPQGYVRFFVRPKSVKETITRFTARCRGRKQSISYDLQLRSATAATKEMPFPFIPKKILPKGRLVPAITEEEARKLSDREILQRGYPPRPDTAREKLSYSAWLRAFSHPILIYHPLTLDNPEIRHDRNLVAALGNTSNNWSGTERIGSAGAFDWVSGAWTVPSVTGESKASAYSTMWVGIDGDNNQSDLVQAGTEQDVLYTGTMSAATYYGWTEFLPQQPAEVTLTDFSVSPGDNIFVEVYVANAGGNPDITGSFGQFVVINGTTGVGGWNYTPRGATAVGGSVVEWIMERPTLTSSTGATLLPDLADFGTTEIDNAWFRIPHHRDVACCTPGFNPVTMVNGSTNLSTPSNASNQTVNFTWLAFH